MDQLQNYLFIAAALFSLGLFAVITRRNAVAVLMGVELILNSANVNFLAFSRFGGMNFDGHVFALFVIIMAAAEAAVALAIIINLYNNYQSINVDEASQLKR
jgi:NADH-quinone oxidoreductase subunit K